MNAVEVTDVCRLCPSLENLINIFDRRLSVTYNMREVILITTGIEIFERDIISKKICQKCCNITLKMFQFRQDAVRQDRELKEKCNQFLVKGIKVPNTCITIKRESRDACQQITSLKTELSPTKSKFQNYQTKLHSSVADVYKNYPHLKLPKKCFERHIAPVVSLAMGEVENYFRQRKLDLRKFIYRPFKNTPTTNTKMVARKRTSFPVKEKTIAPLKINKNAFEAPKQVEEITNTKSVSTPINQGKNKRKRSMSLCDIGKNSSSKMARTSSPVVTNNEILHSPKSTMKSSKSSKIATVTSGPDKHATKQTEYLPKKVPQAPNTPMQTEDNRENFTSITSDVCGATSTSTSKPEFIESLGLTPTVTATKSQTLHVCNLCASVHNNAFELKRHTNKHMVCQFCKVRFKSVEAKQNHIDNSCEVKKIMNSRVTVNVEKIEFNLDVRKKFRSAFWDFATIPGLEATVEEHPNVPLDDVIVLSDDESTETFGDANTATTSNSTIVPVVHDSIVKPDVRIKNNVLVNSLQPTINDLQLVKKLLNLTTPRRSNTTKILQTDLPSNKSIHIHNVEGTCEFKHLKEQLKVYKVPITISNGPFHIAYLFKIDEDSRKSLATWNHLPLIDVNPPKTTPKRSRIVVNAGAKSTTQTLQNPTPSVSNISNAAVPTKNKQIQCKAPTSSPGLQNVPNLEPNLATPLLHNYALNTTTPVITIPSPNRYANQTRQSSANAKKNSRSLINSDPKPSTSCSRVSSSSSSTASTNSTSSTSQIVASTSTPTSTLSPVVSRSSLTNNIPALSLLSKTQANVAVAGTSRRNSSTMSDAAKFRVRNVWELQ